jgi:hypothetical protein
MDGAALWGSDPDEQRTEVESGSEAAALEDSDGLYPARTDRSGNQVVVHLLDGQLIKGHTWNFSPTRPRFHVFPAAPDAADQPVEVRLKDLKAVFFVRTLAGSSGHNERKEFAEHERAPGHTLEVASVKKVRRV